MKNNRKQFPAIIRTALQKLAGDVYFKRGVDYHNAGTVVQLRIGDHGIAARMQGSEPVPYPVRFWHDEQKLQWGCACPLGDEGAFCKHLVAAGLAYLAEGEYDTFCRNMNWGHPWSLPNKFPQFSHCKIIIELYRYRIMPTDAAVTSVASVPETMARMPSATISSRRAGAMVARPPIRIPRLPKLAKPHRA